MSPPRPLVAVLLLVVGFVTGVAGVVLHSHWWGMALALSAMVALLVALPRGWWTRPPAVLGWLVAVGLGAVPRSEGDFLIAGDLSGYTLLVVSFAFLVAAVLGSSS